MYNIFEVFMNILLAVSGSIAAYKSPDICRGLVNQGHKVKVVLSKGSLEFVNKNVFNYLGAEDTFIYSDDFNHKGILHIELSNWLDRFVLAPASANTISKLSQGQCDDLTSSIFLSLDQNKEKIIFPAMNTKMLSNPITQENLNRIKKNPNTFIVESESGLLACGEVGNGKLPDVREIVDLIPMLSSLKNNKKVIVTAGATLSNLDPVRFVTNPAKGGSAYLIARKYLSKGYKVHVIKGQNCVDSFKYLTKHPLYSEETVSTTQDLLDAVKAKNHDFDLYISPMAVSDVEFDYQDSKIKKSSMNGSLSYKHAPDVLKYVLENKKADQIIVGFAAETDLEDTTIYEKMKRKPVDLLVANLVNSGFNKKEKMGFGTNIGTYKLVSKTSTENYLHLPKEELAEIIFKKTENL